MRGDGIWQLFSRPEREDAGEKKPFHPFVVWLILGAILFLAVSSFFGDGKNQSKGEPLQTMVDRELNPDEFVGRLEERLMETLQKISGIGQVSVFIHIEDGGERILAADRSQMSQDDVEDEAAASRMEEESHVILWEQDGVDTPYIVKERFPVPTGVLVVAEGASDDKVKQEIYEAVRAIFGLPAHRIKITN